MKKSIFILFMMASIACQAQSAKEKIADKRFHNLEFASASEVYEELATGRKPKTKFQVRAGESNLMIGNYKKAQTYYDKAYANTGMSDQDLYNYYQVLKYNASYSKANEVFGKINTNQYKLVRDNIVKSKLSINELKKDSSNFLIKKLEINSDENDFSPYLLNNELYFLSSRRNTSLNARKYGWDNSYFIDVYKAYLDGDILKSPHSVSDGIKTKYHEGPMCFTKDGKTQFITRNNSMKKQDKNNHVNLKIMIRKMEGENWGEFKEFPFNSDEYTCEHPAVTGDGNTLYFVSDMPGTLGSLDIWVTNFINGAWTKPLNLGQSVNSEGRESFPFIFEDEVLFYSSDGKYGFGGLDVFYCVPSTDSYFEAQNLGYPLNTQYDDFGFFAKSITTGYLSSNRNSNTEDDIYSFVSSKPLISNFIQFIALDKESRQILPNTLVTLIDENGKPIAETKTDSKGQAKFNVIPGKGYQIKTSTDGYRENTDNLSDKDIAGMIGKKPKEILLNKKIIGLLGVVVDADNSNPIEGVKVTITDAFNSKDVLNFNTSKDGDFKHIYKDKKIGDEISCIVRLEREGYITKLQAVELPIKKEGYVLLQEFLNIKMYKIKLGAELGKMVDLKPIYFDLAKHTIRPDAALELDKIVALIKENPSINIELGSHTDCRGDAKTNMALSDKRAKSSAEYIINKGVNKTRVTAKGYGESRLVNGCACEGTVKPKCDEDGHSQNRRTEFKITGIKN